MKTKIFNQAKWLVAIIAMLTINSTNVWAAAPKLSDMSFSTSGSVRIVNEDFSGVSTTTPATATVANTVSQSAYGIFNYMYNNNTSNSYAILNNSATTGFNSNCVALSAGSGSPLIFFATGISFGNKGAWRIKTTKTSHNMFGIYGAKNNNACTHSETRAFIQNDGGTIKINSSGGWTTVTTVSSEENIIDICVIYNKSGSTQTYGNSISISNNKAHVYVNGDCVATGDNPTEFSISSTALDANALFKILPMTSSGNKCYIDDIQVWNALPGAGALHVTYDGNGKTGGTVPTDASSPYAPSSTVTVLGNTGSLVRTGCTFAGWNTAADGSGTTYAAGETFTISANTTLYAKWAATVTWNDNGGVIRTDNIFVPAAGKSVTPPSDPSTSARGNCGDKFMGWTTTENYKADSPSPGDIVTGAQTITGSVDYYAVFADYAE